MKMVVLILIIFISLVGCKHSDKQDAPESKPIEEPDAIEEPIKEEPVEDIIEEPSVVKEPIKEVVEEPTPETPPVTEEPEKDFATLSWNAPVTRENGDALELYEIDHYVITHTFNDTVTELKVDYMTDTHTFNDLPTGEHEFSIRTVDIDNLVSRESESVSKTIL